MFPITHSTDNQHMQYSVDKCISIASSPGSTHFPPYWVEPGDEASISMCSQLTEYTARIQKFYCGLQLKLVSRDISIMTKYNR